MSSTTSESTTLDPAVCTRALGARDARFDGLFFVGITTTRIYCRPICPARVAYPDHRRFFDSAASAELAGFRPCLRCRPELAPGCAQCDAVPRLARVAAQCIEAGALNGRGVVDLARELGVSERHLRRALGREFGVSPVELAQTYRLLLAKRLLADTSLSVTRVAYASGFQSLRRFNCVFRERYRLSPSALRRSPRGPREPVRSEPPPAAVTDLVRLTLSYRPPLAWDMLTGFLRRELLPGMELLQGSRYARTVRIGDRTGVVFVSDAESGPGALRPSRNQLEVDVSASLLPVLMPLLARLRHVLDLDAQPAVVEQHLAQGGLGALVQQRPGLRILGALDGFEACLRILLQDDESGPEARELAGRVVLALGETISTGHPALTRLAPTAAQVADAGAARLVDLGVRPRQAEAVAAVARALTDGRLQLEPHCDVGATRRALLDIEGIGERRATLIVMRALYWPDAFPESDPRLWRAVGVSSAAELAACAERWRPWRAYAALHLGLSVADD